MSSSIKVSVEKRRDDRFRYGQIFTTRNIDHMVERSPFAFFLTDGIIDDAIGKGIKVVDPETEKVTDWYIQFLAVLNTMFTDVMKGFKYERRYGKSDSILFDSADDALMLRIFSPKNYFVEYSKEYKITKLDAMETVGGIMASTIPHTLTTEDDLDKNYELLIREKETKGQGMSVLEPYWDTLYSLRVLDANATRFAVKEGGGLYVANVPTGKNKDDKNYRNVVREQLQSIDSSMGTITLPMYTDSDGKVIAKPALEQISGDQIDFIAIRDLLIGSLAAGTRIPREVLLGSELGLKSAETNQSAYFSLLQDIQDDYIPYWKWLINTLNKKFNWFTEGQEFDIVYNTRDVMTEEQKIDLLVKKAELVEKLRGKVSDEELSAMVGMTLVEQAEPPIIDEDDEEDDEEDEEEE